MGGIDVVFTHRAMREVPIRQFAVMSCSENLKITLCVCVPDNSEKSFSKKEKSEAPGETE